MGYQALLFCPDEKTARTVTQVLNELEFNVESCIEPFAAVKKLMGQHFDAVVVDCDNEQNATLLFKSARNSTSNQTSLAVAVVEGQAGVAKAFRIGANLVLTKPINIEQAKGTLRVARGLLRKSEPGKAPAAAPVPPIAATPVPPKPAPLKPISAVKPAAPVAPPPVAAPRPVDIPPSAPTSPSAWPAVAAASSTPVEKDAEVLELDVEEPAAKPAAAASIAAASIPHAEQLPAPAAIAPPKTAFTAGSPLATSGAASAPAPARKIEGASGSCEAARSCRRGSTLRKAGGSGTQHLDRIRRVCAVVYVWRIQCRTRIQKRQQKDFVRSGRSSGRCRRSLCWLDIFFGTLVRPGNITGYRPLFDCHAAREAGQCYAYCFEAYSVDASAECGARK